MSDPLYNFIRFPLIALLVSAPWAFGGVFSSTQWMLLIGAAVLLALDFVRTVMSPDESRAVPTLILILFAGLLLGIGQLVPLSPGLQKTLAPQATELRSSLIDDFQNADGVPSQAMPRSLFPASTRENLALLFLATTICYLSAVYLRDKQSLFFLLAAVAVCGVAIACFGIVHKLSSNGKLYWTYPLSYGGSIFGPYVNRNNAAGFLNLCIGGVLGLLVFRTSRSDQDESYERWSQGEQRRDRYDYDAESPLLVQLNAWGLALLIGLAFLTGAIIISASRGSMFALIAATIVCSAMLVARAKDRRTALPVILSVACGVALMAWAGQTEFVQARLEQIFGDNGEIQNGRLTNWPDAIAASRDFRFFGSGLGTYRYTYPIHQDQFIGEQWFFHAENQFIEALLDAGLAGLLLLLMAIATVTIGIVLLYRTGRRVDMTLAVAGAYALTSQIVGGSFDFGLYLPANMMLLAAYCGAIVGRSTSHLAESHAHDYGRSSLHALTRVIAKGWAAPVVSGMLLLGTVFGAIEMRRAAAIESITWETPLEKLREIRESDQVEQLMTSFQPALQRRWDDAEAQRYMADLWMQLYRTQAYEKLVVQLPPTDDKEADLLWDRAALWQLHGTIRRIDDPQEAATLIENAVVQSTIPAARFHLEKSRLACPLIAHVHYGLAEVSLAESKDQDDQPRDFEQRCLQRAKSMAPSDATLAYWSGVLHENSGRLDQAIERWGETLGLSGSLYADLIASRMADKSPEQLRQLPDNFAVTSLVGLSPDTTEATAISLLERANRLFAEISEPTAEQLHTHSTVNARMVRLDPQQAETHAEQSLKSLEKAVDLSPSNDRWRYELAEMFLQLGRTESAREHARILARASKNKRHLQLLKRVNRAN